MSIAEMVVDVGDHLHFGPPRTRAGHRTVPLPRVAAEPLAEHLTTFGRRPENLVFRSPEGGPVQLSVWRRRFCVPASVPLISLVGYGLHTTAPDFFLLRL